ncbi:MULTISPECIES: phage tail assembly chaperone [Providencia]|uniref:phage tail assembly chaperone n=1 Tax=Providencia TaxID=586 RepID=UPI001419C7F0|nr:MULTISPECIES: phage tail assembly chaperone [Providencia]ELR5148235.1 phage tail protein [Providencia rettgeri]ELR5252013.1 phage tail protein [Providencia rettgeri]NIA45498.1 phage tail protein [Providencia rettgeri]NIA99077.1 phage tail protein [Providencia rettgeri]NIB16869.1 phage tail protein [Providencia rettgeri]
MAKAKKFNLRDLALSPKNAYRSKKVEVPEWEGSIVILREPSSEAWLKWRELMSPDTDGEDSKSEVELANRNLQADVVMFSDILLDEDRQRVFENEDIEVLMGIYGPVHARLLKQALDLIISPDEAQKK